MYCFHMLDPRAVTKRDVIACNAHINYQTVLFSCHYDVNVT